MSISVADGTTPFAIIKGEPIAQRTVRSLMGWLSPAEAAQFTLGHSVASPEDVAKITVVYESRRAAVAAREPVTIQNPIVEGDPEPLAAVAARPEVQADFHGQKWTVERVDLRRIISVQKAITTDGLDLRVLSAKNGDAELMELCLPADQPEPPLGAFGDASGLGFTITSVSPNLRFYGSQLAQVEIAPAEGLPTRRMQAMTLFVGMGSSYIQVAHYRGRYFLRDGYHRATGLLKAGINIVPAIFIDADSFEFISPPGNGLFGHEVAYSDVPPMLTDFADDEVAFESLQAATRKVLRVRGDEFVVQG